MHSSRVTIAISNANGWTANADAVIREFVNLDQMHGNLRSARLHADNPKNAQATRVGTLREAERVVEKAVDALNSIIEGVREDFIADEYFHSDSSASEEVESRNEVDNATVGETVISVKSAIDAVIEKMNEEDRKR